MTGTCSGEAVICANTFSGVDEGAGAGAGSGAGAGVGAGADAGGAGTRGGKGRVKRT